MTIFIPPYLGEAIKSNAEKKMYDTLQELDIGETYVLHSLGLPRHKNKVYGEIDFVVICKWGVACLEIKGGSVECCDGKWLFIDRYGTEHQKAEGPFAQVIGNMFSLRTELKHKFPHHTVIKDVLVASGVVFPDIAFTSVSQEIIPEIVYDNRTENISAYIKNVFDYWEGRNRRNSTLLSPSDMKIVVNYLRGNFSFIPTLGDRLSVVEKRLLRLTMEQAQIMTALSMNPRLLIDGGAGTGKTLLAVDFAKRRANKGEKVLYLTYNKNLSNQIADQCRDIENMKIINIHALFGEYVPIDLNNLKTDAQKYFNETLPEQCFDYLNELSPKEVDALKYDVLVMDEGQDILKPLCLYPLDILLKNGLKNGRWVIFYDADQNIYNSEYDEGMEIIESYSCAKFNLYINCRNTIQIGTFSAKVSGMEIEEFLRENGEEVQRFSYADVNGFQQRIKEIMKMLRRGNVEPKDVVFLAPKKYKNTLLRQIDFEVNEIGENFDEASLLPKFSTIQGFKGLDAKIVILTDIENIHTESFSKFMYIAGTRARTLLCIVASNDFWKQHKV